MQTILPQYKQLAYNYLLFWVKVTSRWVYTFDETFVSDFLQENRKKWYQNSAILYIYSDAYMYEQITDTAEPFYNR